MSSLILSAKSTYSRSLLLLLIFLDVFAASLSGYIIGIKSASTFYISVLLWLVISRITHKFNGKNYAHFRNLTYHHLTAIFGHAVTCLVIGILCFTFLPFTLETIFCIVLFWLIDLNVKYLLFLTYYFLRNNILQDKKYLIIGNSPQGDALRKFLKRNHGYPYRYAGTKAEPKCELDLEEIASYSVKNNISTIYYAGSEHNLFIAKLYLLANQHYIYFHYLLPMDEEYSKIKWNITSMPNTDPLLISEKKAYTSKPHNIKYIQDFLKPFRRASFKKKQVFKYPFS